MTKYTYDHELLSVIRNGNSDDRIVQITGNVTEEFAAKIGPELAAACECAEWVDPGPDDRPEGLYHMRYDGREDQHDVCYWDGYVWWLAGSTDAASDEIMEYLGYEGPIAPCSPLTWIGEDN